MVSQLHAAFHRPNTRIFRIVDSIIWVAIILSIILFVVELYLGRDHPVDVHLQVLDEVFILLFVVELVLRVGSFRPLALELLQHTSASWLRTSILGRIRFCLQPLIMVDILTVMGGHPALRGLRALRLLRLLRLLKNNRIFRYSNPFYSAFKALHDNALLYVLAFSLVVGATMVGGVSIFLIEQDINPNINELSDGLWWALVTLTTVGFGDITAISGLGRIVGGGMMICGMFTLALFAGVVGNTLLHSVLSIREEQFRMSALMQHVIICGYEPGAQMLLDAISEELDLDDVRVVIFASGDRPDDLPPELSWISGDPTKESSMEKVRMAYASAAIVVGRRSLLPQAADANTILTLFTIRSHLNKHAITPRRERPLYMVAEILDAENVAHARTAGADEVIETTRLGFSMISHAISQHGSADIMGKITSAGAHSLYLGSLPEELILPTSFGAVSRRMKQQHGILVIGIHRIATGSDQLNPPDDVTVTKGMRLIYLAEEPVLPEA